MPKFAKIALTLVILGGLAGLLAKTLVIDRKDTKSSPVGTTSVPPSDKDNWKPYDQISREQLAERAFVIQRDFLFFYYAILEKQLPEIAKKTFNSGFTEKCIAKIQERVNSFSKEDFLVNAKQAHSDVDYEAFVAESTRMCLQILQADAPGYLSADEMRQLSSVNFFLSAETAHSFLQDPEIRAIMKRVSPENILLTNRFSVLFASRKAQRPPQPSETPPAHEAPVSH